MSIAEGLKGVLQNRDEVMMRGDYGMELFAKRTASGESALSMRATNHWELILLIGADGTVKRQSVLFECVVETFAAMMRDEAQKAAQTPPVRETMPVPAAPQEAAQCVARVPRCTFLKDVRRAYAIATKAGLNVKADEAMRAAFGAFLCKPVASRETLNGSDWRAVGDAMKAGYLTW
jgi:hypothetical protein